MANQADIEGMRRAYEGLSRGDLEGALELIDPDVEVRDRPEMPDPQTYHGYEGVRSAVQSTFDTFDLVDFEPERFVEVGDRIVVVILLRGTGKESGVPVEDRIAHLWTMRDGKAWRMQVYSDPDEAIRDAGAA